MATTEQPCYTLINIPTDSEWPNEMQLKQDLEHGNLRVKTEALKKLIQMILNGEKMTSLLMTVIRFVMPLQDHMMKKLLLVFWEIMPKYSADGKMLHEMILVCDAYRKDLQHPNEFIRGSTLRFLCKLKEPELLEPLMAPIKACLEHRHSYVRRNAVLAIYTIYRNFDFLLPDAPQLIGQYLEGEMDASCKRNAFMMLIYADQEKALSYLSSCMEQVHSFGDILQLVIVELIYKVCHANPSERTRFIRCIYNLLNSSSPAVRYEAAGTLVTLSSAPSAVKAAAQCYIELVVKESDNNVKLIVLDRLVALKETPSHEKVLQDLAMDMVRVLAAPDLEVRKKALHLLLDLVSSRNVEEVVLVLKKEVVKSGGGEHEDSGRYRQLLVRCLHQCCVKFHDVAPTVIPVLIELLSDQNDLAAADVLIFIREAIHRFEDLRPTIMNKLLDIFPSIKNQKMHRAALWILGEYCNSLHDIQALMTLVRHSLGNLPMVEDELRRAAGDKNDDEDIQMTQGSNNSKLVTADGTYASQSAFSSINTCKEASRPPLRTFMMEGDFFSASCLATSLCKLAARHSALSSTQHHNKQHAFVAECMFVMASMLHYGKSGLPAKAITDDDTERIATCIKVLADASPPLHDIFKSRCRESLSNMLQVKLDEDQLMQKNKERKQTGVQADDPICFFQLQARNELGSTENVFDLTLSQALGHSGKKQADFLASSKLNKVTQLTGFSDPVYSEAYVHVNQYDIVLDLLVVNQTTDTLQNLTVELATLGDLKLVEKPQSVVLAAGDFCNIKASVKVASTENGIIFGNIVYDVSGGVSERSSVVLNDLHIDIMDYIVPASCSDADFRLMWAEFEWENKVSVNTNISDLSEYLEHLITCTNMKCLTPDKALHGDCGFMAANLYAKSIFGEDALANLSIERPLEQADATVTGHIRIRAKSQGMALSMGDKINLSQKKNKNNNSA